jgi:hypothetical protein
MFWVNGVAHNQNTFILMNYNIGIDIDIYIYLYSYWENKVISAIYYIFQTFANSPL